VVYPRHQFKPVDLLTFIEMEGFTDDWNRLRLSDDDLMAVQIIIMLEPKGNEVVKGAGGLRKLRYSPQSSSRGKSAGIRVCYVYFQEFGIVLLVVAYAKNEMDNFPASHRRAYRQLIATQRSVFSQRSVK
jgi:hypothetical protein